MNGLSYEYLLKELNEMGIKPAINDSAETFHSITKRPTDGGFEIVRDNLIKGSLFLLTLSFTDTQKETLRASIETLENAVDRLELSEEITVIAGIIKNYKKPL
ncbi:hypothetical protein VB796_21185 [Arcicella sp. LKC2W]|uniref:hypothetical protein n=1 Tax=Arcicella sp. LKC2W TaxID=2984198 RepID=UPI002B20E7B1|nr:hypothetical protein [Arcicella sp. LKC2W]MEA5461595.1 hypothetical protein [Arcicella sp. LKC2W]